MTRLLAVAGLLAGTYALAQQPGPVNFTWNTFTYQKNGMTLTSTYPRWTTDSTDNNKVNLNIAVGTMNTPDGYKCINGTLKVYTVNGQVGGFQ